MPTKFTFHEAAPGEAAVDLEPVRQELLRLGDEGATIGVRQRHAPVREAVFDPGPVAGFGWSTFRGVEGGGPATALRAERHRLANEHLTVDVDPADGTCSIQTADGVRVERAHQLVDGGDGGDTYNYSPPTDDTVVDRPRAVDVAALASGSVRAALGVTSTYLVPSHAEGDEQSCSRRSDELVELVVRTAYELRTGERFLRVHVELENRARDHRLRAQVQLPAPVEASDAECAFAVVRRGLTAEGGPHEAGLPTFVSRRFVDASDGAVGVALLHDGLLEYEVVDSGHILALTLLRATGYLSPRALRCARTRPDRSTRCAGPNSNAASRSTTRSSPIEEIGRPPACTTQPTNSSCRSKPRRPPGTAAGRRRAARLRSRGPR